MSVCRYCEREECDTDCFFADETPGNPKRKTAREFWDEGRSVGLAEINALVAEANALRAEVNQLKSDLSFRDVQLHGCRGTTHRMAGGYSDGCQCGEVRSRR